MVIDCDGEIWISCDVRVHVNVVALIGNATVCFVLAANFSKRKFKFRNWWKIRKTFREYSPPTRSGCDAVILIVCYVLNDFDCASDANASWIWSVLSATVIAMVIWFEFDAAEPQLVSLLTIKCQWLDRLQPKSYFVLLSQSTLLLRFLAGRLHCFSPLVW